MIAHTDMATTPFARSRKLLLLIRSGRITIAGNKHLKIYGTLQCSSGKRMRADKRVFFRDEAAAMDAGYRPCGHCCHIAYLQWKEDQ